MTLRALCEHGDTIGIVRRETGRTGKIIYIAWSCGDMVAVERDKFQALRALRAHWRKKHAQGIVRCGLTPA